MNPNDGNQVTRLRQKMRHHYQQMRTYRENRLAAVTEAAGSRFWSNGPKRDVVVNFVGLMADTLTLYLAGGCPKVWVDTAKVAQKGFARKLARAINVLIRKKIPFQQTMRRIARDAVFGAGVSKMGLNRSHGVELGGIWHDVGQVYVDSVDLDNFGLDIDSYVVEDCLYLFDNYRIRKQDAKDCGYFDADKVEAVSTARPETGISDTGDKTTKALSVGDGSGPEDFEDHIWLTDVYLPKDNLFLTFPTRGDDTTQLRVPEFTEWQGPEGGPYGVLGLGEVALSVLPLPPVANIMHLHEDLNKVARKILNQAKRQKSIAVGQKGQQGDADAVRTAKDGDMLLLDNPAAVKEMLYGGPAQTNIAIFQQMMVLFNYFGYNIEGLAGIRPQAPTLGQEELMVSGAGRRMSDMANLVTAFTTRIVRDIAWYLWDDPTTELDTTYQIQGTDAVVEDKWLGATKPNARSGEFPDYEFDIVPYSMQERSPEATYDLTIRLLSEVIMPLMPVMQASGIQIDVERLLERIGRLKDIDMTDIVTLSGRVLEQEQAGEGGYKPAFTRREYVRRGGAGMSPQGAAQQMALLAGGQQAQAQ